MIKSTPNSNLLTVADSPFQHHLVSLVIYLYIYKQIQMLLDSPPAPSSRFRSFVAMVLDDNAPHLREESLDYKTVAKCFPPQRLWQTELAIGREEGKHGAAWTRQISDKEGKTLKTEALVTTGITQTEETSYDAKGRAIQKSHSYLTGETPTYTTTEYYTSTEDTNQRPKRVTANTGEITTLVYTPTTTTITTENEGELIRTESLTTDAFGQLTTKTVQGESIQYEYNKQGKLTKVIDPANGITSMSYDIGGRKLSQSDQNSGTSTYTYNVAGEMITQTDAKGLTQTFTTDNLGRITKIQPNNSEPAIQYIYDQGNSLSNNNTIGKLTKVIDATGYTEYAYDERGNNIAERKIIDDLTVHFTVSAQ